MNIQDTHVCAQAFLGVARGECAGFVATLSSLNKEWRATLCSEMQAKLNRKLSQFVSFVDDSGRIHLNTPLGVDAFTFNISEVQIDVSELVRALTAMDAWLGDQEREIPNLEDVFRFLNNDVVFTRNTALFLLANVWTCLKLPKCWGASCDRDDIPYNVVDIALLTEWDKHPKQKAIHIFWMFLFLKFVISHWDPDVTVQLDTTKLLMVIIEVSSYLRYQMNNEALLLPESLRKQIADYLFADPVELEDQGVGAEGTLGQPNDAHRL